MVVADINSGDASRVAEAIVRQGGRAEARQVDVSGEDAVRLTVEETAASHGRLDYLFNNAGIGIGGRCPRPDLRALAPGTRRGPVRGHLRHARRLPDHDPAGIRPHRQHLVISRAAARTVHRPYNTSKHAVVGLSLSLRIETADLGGEGQRRLPRLRPDQHLPDRRDGEHPPGQGEPQRQTRGLDDGAASRTGNPQRCRKNQAVIVFPASIRWVWRAYRIAPALISRLLAPLLRKRIRELRSYRLTSDEAKKAAEGQS